MSTKLDKSLDEIISTQRRSSVRGKGGRHVRRSATGKPAPVAPVGGVKKNTRNSAKGGAKAIPTGPTGGGDGRILVNGLPKDVSETMIKDYFVSQVGPVKKVEISYGPGGVSRGTATVYFQRFESATKAVAECNGIPIDGKPIRIELIVDAKKAQAIPPPKGLSERVTLPKSQPKSAATTKSTGTGATRGKKAGRGRGGRNARPAKKTADELDSEMADYFQNGGAPTTEGSAAQPAASGDAAMDDEVM